MQIRGERQDRNILEWLGTTTVPARNDPGPGSSGALLAVARRVWVVAGGHRVNVADYTLGVPDLLLEGRERVAQQPSPANERVREATLEQQRCRHRSRLPQDRSSRTLVTTRKSVRHTINVAEESAVSAAREA